MQVKKWGVSKNTLDGSYGTVPDVARAYKAAGIGTLIVGDENYGEGSSREHAPWALEDYGFRVIIAPSFADIFYNNCFKNGILPIVLNEKTVDDLFIAIDGNPGFKLVVNLDEQVIITPDGSRLEFDVDSFRKHCLQQGLDDIGLTLQHVEDIRAYEKKRSGLTPWLFTDIS